MTRYWYASKYRPPQFGGMPKGALLERERQFPGQRFTAIPYDHELSAEDIEHFSLVLVLREDA
jgi:hypothetical protein